MKKVVSKNLTIVLIIALIVAVVLTVTGCFVKSIDPPKDDIAEKNYPSEFFCEGTENRIDYQSGGNCAAYATAYVLRELGEYAEGESVAKEVDRFFGFVPAKSIVNIFEKYGYFAKAYHGSTETLKQRLINGVPVIVFVSIPSDTHYAVVVGYDEQYFYLADSLAENRNTEEIRYNRKIAAYDFEKIWKTNTLLSDNIYIVVNIV